MFDENDEKIIIYTSAKFSFGGTERNVLQSVETIRLTKTTPQMDIHAPAIIHAPAEYL